MNILHMFVIMTSAVENFMAYLTLVILCQLSSLCCFVVSFECRFSAVFSVVTGQITVREDRLLATAAFERAFPVGFVVMMALPDDVVRQSGARSAIQVGPYHF